MATPKKGERSRYLRPRGDTMTVYKNPPFANSAEDFKVICNRYINNALNCGEFPLTVLDSPDRFLHSDKIVFIDGDMWFRYFVDRSINPPVLRSGPRLDARITRFVEAPTEFYKKGNWVTIYLDNVAHAEIIRAAAGERDVAVDRCVRMFSDYKGYEIHVPAIDIWVLLNAETDAAVLSGGD